MVTDPSLHSTMISLPREEKSMFGNGGEVTSQKAQVIAWMRGQARTMEFASCLPKSFLAMFPGLVAMKARTTVTVLAKMEETPTVKVMLKIVCRRRQETFVGFPMKRNEQRKQRRRETRRT